MAEYGENRRSDSILGAVCGLGLAAASWTLATSPQLLSPSCVLYITVGALCGAARIRIPILGRVGLTYPFTVSALLLFGLGPAVLARLAASLVSKLASRRTRSAASVLQSLFEIASGALITVLAGMAYIALGGPIPVAASSDLIPALGAYVLLHTAAERVVAAAAAQTGPLAADARRAWIGWLQTSLGNGLGAATALLAASAFLWAASRPWLALIPLAAVAQTLARSGARRRRAERSHRSPASYRAVSHALAVAASIDEPRVDLSTRRVQRLAVALGRRMGMRDRELHDLETAALLHGVDRLDPPPRVTLHPGLREVRRPEPEPSEIEILDSIDLPDDTRAFVAHRYERWDGKGVPDGLVGAQIPLGARILAVAESYTAMTLGQRQRMPFSRRRAIEQLRDECGRIFDPRVVDTLADFVRENDESVASREPTPLDDEHQHPSTRRPGDGRDSAGLSSIQRELHALYEVGRAVSYRLDLEENLTLILDKLDGLVPHTSAVVYRFDEERPILRASFARGSGARMLRRVTIDGQDLLSARAAREKRSLIAAEWSRASATGESGWELDDASGDPHVGELRTAMAAPLAAEGRCLGALTLYDRGGRRFTAHERRTLAIVAAQVARAICNADPQHTGYFESLTDPLTGLPNGRYLEISAADLCPVAPGGGLGFGLLAFRIQDLDRVCERMGIVAAERLLGVLARRLAANCTASEVPVRYGHDLFVVLSPVPSQRELVRRWDLLLRALESKPLDLRGHLHRPRLASAHAGSPADGIDLDALFQVLGTRLGLAFDRGHKVVPFRLMRTAG